MPARIHRTTITRIQRLNRIRRTNNLANLNIPRKKRNELFPRPLPQTNDRRILTPPFLGELAEPLFRRIGRRRRINRLDIFGDLVPVLPTRIPESIPQQVNNTRLHGRVFPHRGNRFRQSL